MKPTYDTTIARIAGNIASGLVGREDFNGNPETEAFQCYVAVMSVAFARAIAAEVQRTEPPQEPRS